MTRSEKAQKLTESGKIRSPSRASKCQDLIQASCGVDFVKAGAPKKRPQKRRRDQLLLPATPVLLHCVKCNQRRVDQSPAAYCPGCVQNLLMKHGEPLEDQVNVKSMSDAEIVMAVVASGARGTFLATPTMRSTYEKMVTDYRSRHKPEQAVAVHP